MQNIHDRPVPGEFENIDNLYQLQLKRLEINSAIDEAKAINMDYRKDLLSEYYKVPLEVIDDLKEIPAKERKDMCKKYQINPYVFRTLLDYNRYYDCNVIHNFLIPMGNIRGMNILDFGCLVSDYGFYFGMLGMTVTFCDIKEHADFADYRLGKANIQCHKVYAPSNYSDITLGKDLAIFSEVLEHLKDPYHMFKCCVDNGVKYIYTSYYPYGDDTYFSLPGHTQEAREQSAICFEILRRNYKEVRFVDFKTLWVRKV